MSSHVFFHLAARTGTVQRLTLQSVSQVYRTPGLPLQSTSQYLSVLLSLESSLTGMNLWNNHAGHYRITHTQPRTNITQLNKQNVQLKLNCTRATMRHHRNLSHLFPVDQNIYLATTSANIFQQPLGRTIKTC